MKNYFWICFLILICENTIAQPRFGDAVDEITLLDMHGKTINLSSFKGKVVLLDFWASWCAPCRQANKELLNVYKKYKDQGFEILGVSLDKRKKSWIKAVKKDKITWTQVHDAGGWEAAKWNIVQLPTNYLIDQKGRLFAMDLEGRDLEKAIRELLGN